MSSGELNAQALEACPVFCYNLPDKDVGGFLGISCSWAASEAHDSNSGLKSANCEGYKLTLVVYEWEF
ncbi:hypothetical protein LOK49_LG06G01613 [Camellia lanceoleosa]|uniref:Uncharacterized protein n=1 Tax=Camellia lanceoleosa TaxID=1840588 RepID=A0ACC0HIB3_9ERIC|nr:hypothetical protein LOK49_LG06G01613 [Camellia lanceoleosa]